MARKRQYKKRQDYRKGGRVSYQAGGPMPVRKDYDSGREYSMDYNEWAEVNKAEREGGLDLTPFLGSPGGIDLPTQPTGQPTGGASEGTKIVGNVGGITQQPTSVITPTQPPITQQPQFTPVPAGQPVQQQGQPLKQQGQPVQQEQVAVEPTTVTPEEAAAKMVESYKKELASLVKEGNITEEEAQKRIDSFDPNQQMYAQTAATAPPGGSTMAMPSGFGTGFGSGLKPGEKLDLDALEDTTTFASATPPPTQKYKVGDVPPTPEEAAAGVLPENVRVPEAVPLQEGVDQRQTRMDATTPVTGTRAEGVDPETVTKGTADTVATPDQIDTKTYDPTLVDEDVTVDTAQGEVGDDSLAEAAKVDRVAPVEGADVEIPEGALTDRVVGTLSPEAKAKAAQNAGTSLSRITRAKKQLSKAGLSDEDIQSIGNDPEALEDRLADFTEEERGIIEGLPEEALVSTQIDGLLTGIEEGEIPAWAAPAVANVEAMLARRGLSASSVGRDNLFNAIIQSALPIAQSNAQAIQQSVSQQKNIEAQAEEANAQRRQQVALSNADKVFNLDMAQFSSDQQIALSNSKYLQTVSLTEASNDQQAAIQNAVLTSQANLAEADFYQRAQIQNAQAFLQTDMANLSNRQQSNMLKAQQTQQRMLSNQSASNAAKQFNSTSENQTQQFMASLNAQVEQFNVSQKNTMEQFNVTSTNAAAARDAGRAADVDRFNAQLSTQVEQFNANQDFARNQWNAQNTAAVEQSNVQWRRNVNTVNTAMQNQINMQNAANAFAMSQTGQAFLWQQLRDQADYDFRNAENNQNRIAQLVNTAIASDPDKYGASVESIQALIGAIATDLSS